MNRIFAKSFWLLLTLAFASSLFAASVGQQRFEYLVQQKKDFTFLINETLKDIQQDASDNDVQKHLHENETAFAFLRAKIGSLQSQLEEQTYQQNHLLERLKTLQKASYRTLATPNAEALQRHLKSAMQFGQKNIDLLEHNLALARRYESLLQTRHQQLTLVVAKTKRANALISLSAEKDKLNQTLDKLYQTGIHLQEKARSQSSDKEPYYYEKQNLLNSQLIDLTQSKLALLELNKNWVEAEFNLQKSPSVSTLEAISDLYREGIDALGNQESALKKQVELLKQTSSRFNTPDLAKAWQGVMNELVEQINEIGIQEQTLSEDIDAYEHALSKQISKRSQLPDLGPASWPYIFKTLVEIPLQALNYLKHLTGRVYENLAWQDWTFKLFIFSSLFGMAALAYVFKVLLKHQVTSEVPMRLTRKVYRGLLILLSYNMQYLTALLMLFFVFYFNDVAYTNYAMLFSLIGVLIFFHLLQIIAKLIFLDKTTFISEHDLHLYQQLKRLLVAGAVTTFLMVFSHQYPLNLFIQELFNRFFMLFLLVVSVALWRSKEVINQYIVPVLKTKKTYFKHVIFLLLILVPLTLFTTAIIGLLGYQNLAWTLSRYQAQFLLLLALYVLLKGLLVDTMELLCEWMIASLYNGWLWIEVFLKPLDKLLRLTLLFFLFYAFLKLIDTFSDFSMLTQLSGLWDYVLVNSPGIYITVLSVVQFLALGSVFFWLSKWTREFCYRWLFRQVGDVGIRNSLSVFTQYTVITIGFFITIRVLGFDFTGLSLILGGLAVGMGFGLRDFASNIVGGLTLLIERPVREGDLVSIGGFEGRVSHIGIRSMRVSSWDNMEVLIPNAETFSKPFTNWTHQDSVIRTVIPIKVSREDDPIQIQQLLLDVLSQTEEILSTPAPQVFLKQIDEALISFEIRYFINVNVHTRFEVRSKVLFAISARFKAVGIKPPIPPMQIELSEQVKAKLNDNK